MNQRNYPFYIGATLSAILIALGLLGPLIAPHDPLEQTKLIEIDGVLYGTAPLARAVPPFISADYPLGTDRDMRDTLSRLLWAIRPTLILCAAIVAARVAIGVVLGLLAGWFGGRVAWAIDGLISVSLAVPALAFAVGALLALGISQGLSTFIIALTLTGWCDTASLARSRTQMVLQAPYIESARAIGLGPARILRNHVLPQLMPILPLVAAFEMSATLLLVAELGYLGYYIGGGYVYTYTIGNADIHYLLTSGYPELGQMLSDFFSQLYYTPWVPLFAGLMVFLALAAFALLGEGLRRRLDITRPRQVRWWSRLLASRSPAEAAQS